MLFKPEKVLRITLAFCLILPAMINAEESEENGQEIKVPEIRIIGAEEEALNKVPGAADSVEEEELKREQPISGQQALSRLPGIHAVDTDGFGFFPRISVRGLNPDMSRKVLLLEDGAPVALGPYTDPSSYYFPLIERMKGIEVLKGSGTIRNGPNTIGGTINFLTKDAPVDPELKITGAGGSHGYEMGMIEWGGTFDNISVLVNYAHKNGEGNRANNDFDADDFMLKLGFALNESHFLGVKFTYYRNDANATYLGLTQDMYDNEILDRRTNPTSNDQIKIERASFDVNHEWEINPDTSLKTLLYWNNAGRDWWRADIRRFNVGLNSGQIIDDDQISLQDPALTFTRENPYSNGGRLRNFQVAGIDQRFTLGHGLFGIKNETELGWRYHAERMDNQRVNNNQIASGRTGTIDDEDVRKAHAIAAFAQNRFSLTDKLDITPGVRFEGYRQERIIHIENGTQPVETAAAIAEGRQDYNNEQLDGKNKTYNDEVIPGLGITYRAHELFTIFAGAHKGFAPPRVADVISGTGAAVNLNAERSINYEAGIRGKNQRFSYAITGFAYDFRNQIVSASQSGGATTGVTNAGETLNQGVESEFGIFIVQDMLRFDVNYTYLPVAKVTSNRIPVNDFKVQPGTTHADWVTYAEDRINRQYNPFLPKEHRNQKGNRLPYAPEDMVNAGLTLILGGFEANVQMQYTGEQYSDFENTEGSGLDENIRRMYLNELIPGTDYDLQLLLDGTRGKLPSRHVWHFNTRYVFNDNFEVFASVQNVFNKKYISSRAPEGIFPGLYQFVSAGATATF